MKKLALPEVTLISATSVGIDNTVAALSISSREIEFGSIKLLASSEPAALPKEMEFVSIPPMTLLGYSRFMLKDLQRYVDTPFCLVVQADGFVINPDLWRGEFFQYDYIGAPWPEMVKVSSGNWNLLFDKNRVGNGGFSLRSKKLLDLCSSINFDALHFPLKSEDVVICHYLYEQMVVRGIKFAPPEVAALFSMEDPSGLYGQTMDSVFGFHGKHLMKDVLKKIDGKQFSSRQVASDFGAVCPNGRIGRNEACPCGSGMKYKKCHGRLA